MRLEPLVGTAGLRENQARAFRETMTILHFRVLKRCLYKIPPQIAARGDIERGKRISRQPRML
jgi:hypothetical protein